MDCDKMKGLDERTVDLSPMSGNAGPVDADHADDEQQQALIHLGTPLDGHVVGLVDVFVGRLFRGRYELKRRECLRHR